MNDTEAKALKFAQEVREASARQRDLAVDLYPHSGHPDFYKAKNALIDLAAKGDKLANAITEAVKQRQQQ